MCERCDELGAVIDEYRDLIKSVFLDIVKELSAMTAEAALKKLEVRDLKTKLDMDDMIKAMKGGD